MSVFSVEFGGMTSGSGLSSSGWQRSESRLVEREKKISFVVVLLCLKKKSRLTNKQNKLHFDVNIRHRIYTSSMMEQKTPGPFVNRNTMVAMVASLIRLHCGEERLAAGQSAPDLKLDSKALFNERLMPMGKCGCPPRLGNNCYQYHFLKNYVIAISSGTLFSVTKTERIKQLTCSLLSCLTVSVATHFHNSTKLL